MDLSPQMMAWDYAAAQRLSKGEFPAIFPTFLECLNICADHHSVATKRERHIMDFGFLYTQTAGRISRKSWWLGTIGLIIIVFLMSMIVGVAIGVTGAGNSGFGQGLSSLILIGILFVPYRALTLKRLHDRSRPENLFWIFIAPSILSPLLMMAGLSGSVEATELFGQSTEMFKPNAIGSLMGVVSLGVGLWSLFELGIVKGDSGDNAHGPDPLAPKAG